MLIFFIFIETFPKRKKIPISNNKPSISVVTFSSTKKIKPDNLACSICVKTVQTTKGDRKADESVLKIKMPFDCSGLCLVSHVTERSCQPWYLCKWWILYSLEWHGKVYFKFYFESIDSHTSLKLNFPHDSTLNLLPYSKEKKNKQEKENFSFIV